jgi:hypothetical protein
MHDVTSVQPYLERLAAALRDRDLRVAINGASLKASNPAASTDDPRGRAMNPGLTQDVMLRRAPDGGLMWCWVWEPRRSAECGAAIPSPPDVEPLCPADDIDEAARRIAAVLRHGGEPSDG